jgi:hypothetical protein
MSGSDIRAAHFSPGTGSCDGQQHLQFGAPRRRVARQIGRRNVRACRLSHLARRRSNDCWRSFCVVLMNGPNGRHSRRRGHRQLGAVSQPSARLLLARFGHGSHSLFIGGQPFVSHLDLDGEISCDA